MKNVLNVVLLILLVSLILFLIPREQMDEVHEIVLPSHPGLPGNARHGEMIEHQFYTLSYSEQHEQAFWTMYRLTAENLSMPKYKRTDNFRVDTLVSTGSATKQDYKGSGFDRGHLVPAGDMSWSEVAMSESFYMSNMSTQAPGFNRGIWKRLESQVREWASANELVYVVSGPVLNDGLETIGANKVSIPRFFYKVIIDYAEPEIKSAAFVFENKKSGEDLFSFAVSIDSVERLTGLDFFPALPDGFEKSLEATSQIEAWLVGNSAESKGGN